MIEQIDEFQIEGGIPQTWETILTERLDKIEHSISELRAYIANQAGVNYPYSVAWKYYFEEKK